MNEPTNTVTNPAPPANPKAETANRIQKLKSEVQRLEWENRPPVPEPQRRLAFERERVKKMRQLSFADQGGFFLIGVAAPGDSIIQRGVSVEFGHPSVFVSVHANLPLADAKFMLEKATTNLLANLSKLKTDAKTIDRDFGRDKPAVSPPTPPLFGEQDDLPF